MSEPVEYRDVPGFPGYRVGDDGSVWSCIQVHRLRGGRKGQNYRTYDGPWRQMKLALSSGRLCVKLYNGGRSRNFFIHRLVLLVFRGPKPVGLEGCHNDGNRLNNRLDNLRYDTHESNVADRIKHDDILRGSKHGCAKLNEGAVRTIRARLANGEKLVAVAADYGVDFTLISQIKRNRIWRHVA